MDYRASKTTRVTLDADRQIGDGQTITVYGIIIANNHATQPASVEFQSADEDVKFTLNCPAQDSKVMDIEFVADKGLEIDSIGDASVIVSVFHSQAGS
jgi:hypothetical protein